VIEESSVEEAIDVVLDVSAAIFDLAKLDLSAV